MNSDTNILWSPEDYAGAAVIASEAGQELFSRLELITLQPKVIVDAGCGTGSWEGHLQARYPDAFILSMDYSETMLRYMQSGSPGLGRGIVCADVGKMPLRDHSVDLLFANLLLPWCQDFAYMLREWRRVLRPDGMLIFSAFGMDTLREWNNIIPREQFPQLIDMHDIGDMLLQEGFADPVLDVNYLTTTYRDRHRLVHELIATGMCSPELDSKTLSEIDIPDLAVTYEVIHAHAFTPPASQEISASADGVVRIPLSHLRQSLRAKSD
jgi:malonyl-CoA O-methyltransferase